MNLRSIIIGLSAISALGLVAAACSSSSTTTNTGGNPDGGGTVSEGGGGGGGGGTCGNKLADGTYTVTTKATPGSDVDASSPIEGALCMDGMTTFTVDSTKDAGSGGTTQPGCTSMTSSDGCTQTITCSSDSNGTKSDSTIVITINADGTFTQTTTIKLTEDDGGAVTADCTTVGTGKKN